MRQPIRSSERHLHVEATHHDLGVTDEIETGRRIEGVTRSRIEEESRATREFGDQSKPSAVLHIPSKNTNRLSIMSPPREKMKRRAPSSVETTAERLPRATDRGEQAGPAIPPLDDQSSPATPPTNDEITLTSRAPRTDHQNPLTWNPGTIFDASKNVKPLTTR